MPLFDLGCSGCDHVERDRFFHVRPKSFGTCTNCGGVLTPLITGAPVPLTKTFAEDREYTDYHIRPDGKPQKITSWGQRKRLMKEFNLEEAGVKRGMKGCWS